MTPAEIVATVKAYGARLFLDEDGDLSCECGHELPVVVLGLVRDHRPAIVTHLGNPDVPAEADAWHLDDPIVAEALRAFGDGTDDAKVAAVVRPGEAVPVEFADVVVDWPVGKPSDDEALKRCWLHIACQLLNRDFNEYPADKSTLESWRRGLACYPDKLAQLALARIAEVKPTKWGRRDIAANRLLPRRKPANAEEATS